MATTGEQTLALRTSSLTGRDWVGVLAAVTGVVHLFLGIRFAPAGLGIAFLLAGLGFAGAIVLVPIFRTPQSQSNQFSLWRLVDLL